MQQENYTNNEIEMFFMPDTPEGDDLTGGQGSDDDEKDE